MLKCAFCFPENRNERKANLQCKFQLLMNNGSYEIKYLVRCDATDEETKIVQLSILA